MILIIGGYAAGKYSYVVNELGYDENLISHGKLDDRPVLINLQNIIRDEATVLDEKFFEKLCAKEIITCTEVGSGVVPFEKNERDYREDVGRICIELAKRADRVIRIYCGIPTIIKENKC